MMMAFPFIYNYEEIVHNKQSQQKGEFKRTFKISIAFLVEAASIAWPFCFCAFICQKKISQNLKTQKIHLRNVQLSTT